LGRIHHARRPLLTGLVTALLGALVVAVPAQPASAADITCTIHTGESGRTYQRTATFGSTGDLPVTLTVNASSFVRRTSGPCTFKLRNHVGDDSPSVVIGTDLNERIWAGPAAFDEDCFLGVLCESGGHWRVREIVITPAAMRCSLVAGGNGIRMRFGMTGGVINGPFISKVDSIDPGCVAYLGDGDRTYRYHSALGRKTYDAVWQIRIVAAGAGPDESAQPM